MNEYLHIKVSSLGEASAPCWTVIEQKSATRMRNTVPEKSSRGLVLSQRMGSDA